VSDPSEGRRRYRPATFGRVVLLVVVIALVGVLALVAFRPGSTPPTPTRNPSGTAVVDNPAPQWLTEAGGSLFFVAKDPTHGRELWTSDGTRLGTVLVKDIRPGAHGSGPSALAAVEGTLYFSASDGTSGRELWMSDGTAKGTVLVDDIVPGTKGSGAYIPAAYSPDPFGDLGGTLFFTADDGIHGYELWTSDGTAEGTRQVRDIHQGPGDSNVASLVGSNGLVFFTANDGSHGTELWRSDGTSSGTILLRDLTNVRGWWGELTDVDGTLFFTPQDGDSGELWRTDGSTQGTVLVRDFTKGDDCSFGPRYGYIDFCVSELAASDGTLFFVAGKPPALKEPWMSDGTRAGTILVKDLTRGSSGPMWLTDVAGTLFFVADVRGVGNELWRTDGTPEGTVMVRDIAPDRDSSYPYGLAAVEDVVYFWPQGLVPGAELWMSDGTKFGTVLVRDVLPGVENASLSWMTAVGDSLYFVAADGEASHLWTSDGTEQSTIRLM
jgi:trimeric autotransporter adhesin